MNRKNQILFAVLLLLGLFWGVRSWMGSRPPPPPFSLPAVKAEDANAIEITHLGNTLSLGRVSEKKWQLTSPKKADADPNAVDSVFTLFKDPLSSDMIAAQNPKDLVPYGLDDKGKIHLVIKGGDKTLLDLEIGKSLSGGAAFFRPTGSKTVYRGKLGSRVRLEKKADDWRDKRILDFKKEDVAALELRSGSHSFSFTRTDKEAESKDSVWTVISPAGMKLDSNQADSVARGLGALRANDLVDDPAQAAGAFDSPQAFASVKLEDGSSWSVTFGARKEDKKVWIRRDQDGAVFVVTETTMSRFQKQPKDLRDKSILSFKRVDVTEVTLTDQDGSCTAVPEGEDSWKSQAGSCKIDGKEMTFTLNTLSSLRAADLMDSLTPDKAGTRGKGSLAVSLKFKDGTSKVLRLSPLMGVDKDKKMNATVDGESQVYALKEFTLNSVKRGFGKAPKGSAMPPGMAMPQGMPGGTPGGGVPGGLPPGIKLPPGMQMGGGPPRQ